jgi:hypothetical protein
MKTEQAERFVERRKSAGLAPDGQERRQFAGSRELLSPEARELAEAIDAYKLSRGRRYITVEEVLQIIKSLGYRRETPSAGQQ